MDISNNPVGRLYQILGVFQNSPNQGERFINIIREVFRVGSRRSSPDQARSIFWEILNLIKASKIEVYKLPTDSQELHLRAIRTVEEALTDHGLLSSWASINRYLQPATLIGLEHTAHDLSYLGDRPVTAECRENLRREVAETWDLVSQTRMDMRLRAYLMQHLERIQQDVQYLEIRGVRSLKEALERLVGAGIIFTAEYQDIRTPAEVRSRMESIMRALTKVVASADDFKPLEDMDISLLLQLP